jgi:tetratricopeptide (TPR) repeat protein
LLERDAANLDALLALGETLWSMGRAPDAGFAVQRILRFDPEHAGALFNQGVQYAARHRYRDASAAWKRVIDLEPAGEYARRARRELRSAKDLDHIFRGSREVKVDEVRDGH